MKNTLLIFCLFLAFFTKAQTVDDVYQTLENGDWVACTQRVADFYMSKGLYADAHLTWDKKDANQLYNAYDATSYVFPVIEVADFVQAGNVWAHWDFWSESLTKSSWNSKAFFKNKKEAVLLARYNVLILMSHEFAHHLADRYKVEPENLNCKEYDADKLSYGLERWLRADVRFEKLQARYRELLIEMNGYIPEVSRFSFTPFDKLEADCACVKVTYPTTAELMPQYASAFFVRRMALYSNPNKFDLENYLNAKHLKSDNDWVFNYPRQGISFETSYLVEDRYSVDQKTAFDEGIKLMKRYGEGFNQDIGLQTFVFDNNGKFFNVQSNINKTITPSDLWDFRFYDSAGFLSHIWNTTPPLLESILSARISSVCVDDLHENIALILELEQQSNQHAYYLLKSSADGLTLDWYWLETTHAIGLALLNLELKDSAAVLSLSGIESYKISPVTRDAPTLTLNRHLVNTEMNKLKNQEVGCIAGDASKIIFSVDAYLLRSNSNNIVTIAGNGLNGNRCDQHMVEVPDVLALKVIGNTLYSAHIIQTTGHRKQLEVRRFELSL